jgi:hypothetical protein
MGGERGKRGAGRGQSGGALSRWRGRAHGSQPPDGAKADGRGFGIGFKHEQAPGTLEKSEERRRSRWK